MRLPLPICFLACLLPCAALSSQAGEEGAVLVGEVEVLRLRAPGPGGLSPAERAEVATRRISAALADPEIGPEDIRAEVRSGGVSVLAGRLVLLDVQAGDADAEKALASELGDRWAGLIREPFGHTKSREFTLSLLVKYFVALTYPLILAVALIGITRLRRRGMVWIHRIDEKGASPLSIGRFELASTSAFKLLLRGLLSLLSWGMIVAAVLVFLLATFYYFPATRGYASSVMAAAGGIARAIGRGLLENLLRLGMIALVWAACGAILRAWGRFFDQVEAGRVRLAPYVTVENADTLEYLAKGLTFLGAAIVTVLLLPGEQGQLAKGVLLLVGLAISLASVNILKHALAGSVLAFQDSHRRGALLRVEGREAMVMRRGLLLSTVRFADGRSCTLPNEQLLGTPVLGQRGADLVAWSGRVHLAAEVPLTGLQQRLEQWVKEWGSEAQVLLVGMHKDEVRFEALVPYIQASSDVFMAVAVDGLRAALAEGGCRLLEFSPKRSEP